jgi:hypothetical protein
MTKSWRALLRARVACVVEVPRAAKAAGAGTRELTGLVVTEGERAVRQEYLGSE